MEFDLQFCKYDKKTKFPTKALNLCNITQNTDFPEYFDKECTELFWKLVC